MNPDFIFSFTWVIRFMQFLIIPAAGYRFSLTSGRDALSARLPEKIVCFIRDSASEKLYVQTPGNITVLDAKFRFIETTMLAGLTTTEGSNVNASNKSNGHHSCVIGDTALKLDDVSVSINRLSKPQLAFPVQLGSPSNASIVERMIFSFNASNQSYAIGVKDHKTWLWNTNPAENITSNHRVEMRCKAPNFKREGFVIFQEAKAVILVAKNSSSVFVLFVMPSKKLSVVCEYPDLTKTSSNHTLWESSIASAILPSLAAGIDYMHFYGKEVLIVREQHDIKMIWLPLLHNTIQPQSILANDFGDDVNYDDFELPNITGMAPNGNRSEVVVAIDNMLTMVPLDKCAQYSNCTQCLRSTDSPCGWCYATKRCAFIQFCQYNIQHNTTSENMWIDSTTGNEEYCRNPRPPLRSTTTKRYLSPQTRLLPTRKAIHPKTTSPAVRTERSVVLQPSSPEEPSDNQRPISTLQVVLGVTVVLFVVLTIMIAVTLVRYLEIRKANIKTAKGFPECRGIRSYKQMRDVLRRARAQRQHSRLNQEADDEEPGQSINI